MLIDHPAAPKTTLSSFDDSDQGVSSVNKENYRLLTQGSFGITTANRTRKLIVKYVRS